MKSPMPYSFFMAKKQLEGLGLAGGLFAAMMLVWVACVAIELAKGRMELLPIVGGFVFFQLCNWAVEYMLENDVKLLSQVPPASADTFINTSTSLLHSTLLSFSVGACLVLEYSRSGPLQMMQFESLYSEPWPGAYSLLAFSCGYFAYDQVDMLRRHLYGRAGIPPLLMHHWLLLNCFTLALVRHVSINYLILTLICEMHSIFLHWRRVGRMAGIRKTRSRALTIEWILNWTTFFSTRLFVHAWISFKLYLDAPKFPNKMELLLAASGMLALDVLNALLGIDLCKACCKELSSKHQQQKKST